MCHQYLLLADQCDVHGVQQQLCGHCLNGCLSPAVIQVCAGAVEGHNEVGWPSESMWEQVRGRGQ